MPGSAQMSVNPQEGKEGDKVCHFESEEESLDFQGFGLEWFVRAVFGCACTYSR